VIVPVWAPRRSALRAAVGLVGCGWLVLTARADAHAQAAPKTQARECFQAAQAAYLAGRLDEARRGFECAYAQLPSAELAWNLGRVAERMGDVDAGVRYFRDYLARTQVSARERRGVEARIQKLLDLQARQAAQLKPGIDKGAALSEDARNFFQRGVKLYAGGHYAAAGAAFSAALQMSNAPELHYNLAMTSERMGNLEDACDHYRAYLSALPTAPDRNSVEAHVTELRAKAP
jgi:tetratricopeptide (TPR) repeat protein